jgi:hypothetical protein
MLRTYVVGRLWLGDVGQDSWEEINIVRKGRNYGWPRMEGNECYSPSTCDTTGLNVVAPLYVYPHDGSASVTGGFVYRGPSMPSLAGKYIYADYITGEMWALAWDGVNPPINSFLTTVPNVPSFDVDATGELFIASFGGDILRLFNSATPVRDEQPAAVLRIGPNPFEAGTTIAYSLAGPARVRTDVFDVAGRRVTTLLDRVAAPGAGSVTWTPRGRDGNRLPSGVYFVRFSLNGRALETHRVTLLQ